VGHPSLASEFPNDNAAISAGAIWICAELTGPAAAELPAYEPVAADRFVLSFDEDDAPDGPVEIGLAAGQLAVSVLEPSDLPPPDCQVSPEPAAPSGEQASRLACGDADPADLETPAFARFERALVSALLAQGSTRAAALVPRLLRLEPLPAEALTKDVQLTLQSRGYLDGNARYCRKYRELCGAWSAVLRGSSQDFAACGTTTLDRFGADLLAALLAVPTTRADELRRELRKAGIAAFGVLDAA
jgi:hypothetical protein